MEKRLAELDLVRAIAIIGVVMIHSASFYPWFNSNFSWSGYFFYFQVTSYSVQAFILLSGLLLTVNSRHKKFNYIKFMRGKVYYIVIPYLVWSGVYELYRWDGFRVEDLVDNLLTGKAYFHLYFVVVIIQLYVLYPFFRKLAFAFRLEHIVFAVLAQIALNEFIPKLLPDLSIYFGVSLFTGWVLPFYIGCVIGAHYEIFIEIVGRWINAIVGVLAALLLYKVGDYYYTVHIAKSSPFYGYAGTSTIQNIPYMLSVVSVAVFFGRGIRSSNWLYTVNIIAVNAYGIYLSHVLVIRGFRYLFETFNIVSTNIAVACVLFGTLIISLVLVVILATLRKRIFVVKQA